MFGSVRADRADMTWAAPDRDLMSNAHTVELLHDVLRVLLVLRLFISIDLPQSLHLLLIHLTPKALTSCAAWGGREA